MRPRSPTKSRSSFTLVELMVTTAIVALVLGAALPMFLQVLKMYKFDGFRLEVNGNMRKFTTDLTRDATYASYFLIYPAFTSATSTGSGSTAVLSNLAAGNAGDYLLLVYKDPANDSNITQITGYFRDTVTAGGPSVRTFTITYNPSTSALIPTLLPASNTVATTEAQVIPDFNSEGLPTGATASVTLPSGVSGMFYNLNNKSIIVNAEVQYTANDRQIQSTTSAYNFTVSPRG